MLAYALRQEKSALAHLLERPPPLLILLRLASFQGTIALLKVSSTL